jgi:alpha-beta hydrolase superfamily lysophospholipase
LKHPRLQGSPLVAFGRSLGGAVSIDLAERFPSEIKAVIVENTFLSISAMVDKLMPVVASLKNLVLRIGWNNDKSIINLRQPILFVSGA